MPYIVRDENGGIRSVSKEPTTGAVYVANNDGELAAFLADFGTRSGEPIRATDLDFVRVLEDLVELLISKGVILFTELPESAREKMLARQRLRSEISGRLDLLGDD